MKALPSCSALFWATLGLGGAALAETVWVLVSFVRPRRERAADPGPLVVAGAVEDFATGSVTAVPAGRFYLVRLEDGGSPGPAPRVHAPRVHRPVGARAGALRVPLHASAFVITGAVLNAPAPRPLDFYPVRIENGVVKVDTRRRFSRTAFDPSQVTVG